MRKLDPTCAGLEVARVLCLRAVKMADEFGLDPSRQHRAPIARTLPGAHENFMPREVEVLHA
jgi:hypothetical protein